MDKLTKTWTSGEIFTTEGVNNITSKINELIDANGLSILLTGGLDVSGNYELILSKSASDTTETGNLNKTSKLTYNPSTYELTNGGCSLIYDATNKCLKFIFN